MSQENVYPSRQPGYVRGRGDDPAQPVRGLQLHDIIRVARRRKWFIAGVAAAGTVLSGIAAFAVPPTYTATAQLLVEPSSSEVAAGLLEPVVDTHIAKLNSDARLRQVLQNLSGRLQFDSSREAVSPNLSFDERLRTWLAGAASGLKSVVSAFRSEPSADTTVPTGVPTLDDVKKALLVRQERRSTIIAVSYKDTSPEKSALIANQIVLFHVGELREAKRSEAERVQSWLDQRVTRVLAELQEAETAVRVHHAAHGAKNEEVIGAETIAAMIRQLTLVQSELSARRAKIDRLRAARAEASREHASGSQNEDAEAAETRGDAPAQSAADADRDEEKTEKYSEQALARLNHEVQVFESQVRSLEQQLEALRTAAGSSLKQQMESHAVEIHAASARKLLDDLVRRQQEAEELAQSRGFGARVLALAPTPLRPSSLSPFLLIPPAFFAFALLGATVSMVRERLDRSLRSEDEVTASLGIPCLGVIPTPPSSRRRPDYRSLVERRSLPYSKAVRSTAITALNVIPPCHDARTILVTSCGSDGTATMTGLSMSLAVCIARLGHRVLLIAFGALDGRSMPIPDAAGDDVGHELQDLSISAAVQHDAQLGLDCFSIQQISGDPMSLVASRQFSDILQRLRARYDCVIIDAPSVFSSPEVRLLATKVDGTILAIKWGSTRPEAAINALHLLRQIPSLRGEPAAKIYAVLAHAEWRARTQFSQG